EKDYGYIFDPDLTRQELDEEFREKTREEIPELPHEKFDRFKEEYGLKDKLVESLVTEPELADDFEVLADSHDADLVASFLTGDLKKVLNYNEKTYSDSDIQIDWLKYLVELLEEDQISDRNAEQVLREIVEEPQNPEGIVEEEDLLKAEEDEISEFVEEAIEENPDAVEDYRNGDEEAVNFLVGQVMSISQGKADPKEAREKIIKELGE
ncbi:MAG: Asp-tRNA(Asn)/Glu-tRNA(Gln) amidotransferase GatCAB subunit B, partial [Candidatus Nanohalobium sp.]